MSANDGVFHTVSFIIWQLKEASQGESIQTILTNFPFPVKIAKYMVNMYFFL